MDKRVFMRRGFTLAAHAGSFAQHLRNDDRIHKFGIAAQQFVLAFVLSRAAMFGGYAPFGLAFTAAAASIGGGYAALAGLILGSILLCGGLYGITAAAGGLLALVCACVFDRDLRSTTWFMPVCAMACMAGTGFVLIPAATLAHFARFGCVVAVTGVMTACYQFAMGPARPVKFLRPAGLLAVAASALVALSDIRIMGTIAPARILLYLLVLSAAYLGGSTAGTVAGVATGALLDAVQGQGAFFTCVYGLSALIAGAFQNAGRVGFAIAALVAGIGAALVGADNPVFVFALYEGIFAVLVYAAVPTNTWQCIKDSLQPVRRDTTASIARIRHTAGRCANEASAAFQELYAALCSGVEHGRAETNDEVHAVFDRATDAVCSHCEICGACWQKESVATMGAFHTMAVPMLRRGRAETGDFPPGFQNRCVHLPELVQEINRGLAVLHERRAYQQRTRENRALIAEQYAGLTEILRQVGGNLSADQASLPARERQVRSYAQAFGKIDQVAVFHDVSGRLRVELAGEGAARILQERRGFAAGLSALLGRGLSEPECVTDDLGTRIVLREQAPYRVVAGMSQRQKDGETVSGDTVQSFVTEDGRACMLLADGMGTGAAAAKDSQLLVGMMERFLRAGIRVDDALHTVAPAFRMRVEGMRGVTLDALTIDLYTGRADCLKCGAAPGYLRAGGSITTLAGETLPVGLMESAEEAQPIPLRMMHGDIFVMLSDGVSDGLDNEWVKTILADHAGDSPKELAARLVIAASEKGASDDLTALVVRLERRKPASAA